MAVSAPQTELNSHSLPIVNKVERRSRIPIWVVAAVALAALVLFLATYHLSVYPTPWFDEGEHLHVPKTLIQFGQYADISSEGFRYFGPTIGVGPMVMLPIALAFKLGGIGLTQARLVMAAYLLVAIGLFFAISRRQFGVKVSLLATALLITTPSVQFIETGRQVLGEVPGFAFLMLGVLFWWRSTEKGATRGSLIVASIAFGLAGQTKNDLGMILVPTLAAVFILDRIYYRQLGLRHVLIPIVCVGAGVISEYLVLVPALVRSGDPGQFVSLMRNASAGAIFVFSPSRMLSAAKFVTSGDVYAYWGLPSLAYGCFLARSRSRAGVQQAFLLSFAIIGLSWFTLVSIGWPRYAFSFLGITAIFAAKFLVDLIASLNRINRPLEDVERPRLGALPLAASFAVGLFLLASTQSTVRAVVETPNTDPQQMASYLTAHLPTSTVIETWEPELGFLTDHRYHYPPPSWLDRAVRAQWLGSTPVVSSYDPIVEAHPDYLLVGPFANYTGIYDRLVDSLNERPIESIGQYRLYRLSR
jgi:hypothetical protein